MTKHIAVGRDGRSRRENAGCAQADIDDVNVDGAATIFAASVKALTLWRGLREGKLGGNPLCTGQVGGRPP